MKLRHQEERLAGPKTISTAIIPYTESVENLMMKKTMKRKI